MRFLELCAGSGGFSLGLEMAGMTCAGQVEINVYRQKVLAKHWPDVPRWGDIRTVNPADLPPVDLICGGYPCQPFSEAGKRRGAADDRYLWAEVFRLVRALRPTWCLFENVDGHRSLGLDPILADLESAGYACQTLGLPACAVDAKQIRERIWILAHTPCSAAQRGTEIPPKKPEKPTEEQFSGFLLTGARASVSGARAYGDRYGVSRGVDAVGQRRSAMGDAVVPQLVQRIGKAILAAHRGVS